MELHDIPHRVLHPEPLSPQRQKDLNCDTFWRLMDRWEVPADRALTLIGCDAEPMAKTVKPSFPLSDEQAKVVSCLLEIELTLAVAGVGRARHRKGSPAPSNGTLPLDAMGRCDPSRAAIVLWSMNRTGRAKPRPYSRASLPGASRTVSPIRPLIRGQKDTAWPSRTCGEAGRACATDEAQSVKGGRRPAASSTPL